MSVFGGDSWAQEAQYRKRRVDDFVIEGIAASVYKKLSNGKYACLICPKNPVLDTPIMLASHVRGSRHRANELRYKDRGLATKEEVKKRLSFSGDSVDTKADANASIQLRKTVRRPLIEKTRKVVSEMTCSGFSRSKLKSVAGNLTLAHGENFSSNSDMIERAQKAALEVPFGGVSRLEVQSETGNLALPGEGFSGSSGSIQSKATHGVIGGVQLLDYRECHEMELKFTAAGWRRDCHGRWFKDENVEFDSDEEDPNIVLNNAA